MGLRVDEFSQTKDKPREVLIYSDLDRTSDGPASKGYVDSHSGGGGGISDGNKGDITVSGSGTTWELNEAAMAKIQRLIYLQP